MSDWVVTIQDIANAFRQNEESEKKKIYVSKMSVKALKPGSRLRLYQPVGFGTENTFILRVLLKDGSSRDIPFRIDDDSLKFAEETQYEIWKKKNPYYGGSTRGKYRINRKYKKSLKSKKGKKGKNTKKLMKRRTNTRKQ